MNSMKLRIVSPDGCLFDGDARLLTLRTTQGDVSIMANHTDYAAAIGMGQAVVVTEEGRRTAACIGGMLIVSDNKVDVIATTFEWKEDLDAERAEKALADAERILSITSLDETSKTIALAKKRRAQVRLAVARG